MKIAPDPQNIGRRTKAAPEQYRILSTLLNIAALGIGSDSRIAVAAKSYPDLREGTVAPVHGLRTDELRIEIRPSIAASLADWRRFEREAVGTLYQNSTWCQAWSETVGSSIQISPRIVFVTNAAAEIQLVLPLQIRRRQGVRVLEWLGSPHHNYGLGLYRPAFLAVAEDWFATHWDRLLSLIGGFDAIALTEMPDSLQGRPNPMRKLGNLRSANPSFHLDLEPDFEALHARRKSAERRRASRKHENGLAQAGPVWFGLPEDKASLISLIDTMFDHQRARLAELGIHGVFGPQERQFIQRLAEIQDADDPILAPYAFSCGGQVLAVMLGGLHGNTYWALISSLAPGPLRKYSPGDLALRRTIEACCKRGLTGFDFSAGDSAYKRGWTDDVIEMSCTVRGLNLRGIAWAGLFALRLAAKRAIKQSPLLFSVTQGMRRSLWGARS